MNEVKSQSLYQLITTTKTQWRTTVELPAITGGKEESLKKTDTNNHNFAILILFFFPLR